VSSQVTGKSANEPAEHWRTFEATAYIALCDSGCSGVTYTGLDVRQHITVDGRRVVATDPEVIAMGTTLTIRLADGTEIDAIAADVGSAIKGRKVDVLMANLHDAKQFGRQAVEVRLEAEPTQINE
jgi:3D (Asp-Asp-Asp) domain-containing protein